MAEEGGGSGRDGTVVAALIGGIAVVAAAVLPGLLGPKPTPDPTPTQSASPSPTPTPSATPTAEDEQPDAAPTHRIVIANECPKPFWLYLYFHNKDGWTKNGGARWSYDGPETSPLQRLGSVLRTDRDEIYVHGLYKDGTLAWNGGTLVRIDGVDLGFQKATAVEGADGSYTLHLACTAELTTPAPTPTS